VPPVELWAYAFAWTIAIEVPIVAALCWRPLGLPRAIAVGLGLQALTHPALWYVAPRFEPYDLWLVVMETTVTLVEAGALAAALRIAGQPLRAALLRGLLTSVAANATSTVAGLFLL
jgi:hypothetical protein